jgi:hypothetical protein
VAALYALLRARHPRRVLVAYLVAGFAFSVAVGTLVLAIFQGAHVDYGRGDLSAALELLAGVAALGFAVGVASGRAQPPTREQSAAEQPAVIRRLRNPSVATAALAGVATHLPGLFYIVALNSILADEDSLAAGVALVLVFNAIWFGAAIASVVVFLLRPGAARRALTRADAWVRRHSRATTIVVFGGVGVYLSVKGATELIG